MDNTVDLRVLEMLCSRLCHDLVSPVGAVNNGVELVREFGADMQEDALELIEASGRAAAGRLAFFRLAFGLGGSAGSMISAQEGRELARGFFDNEKITLAWPDDQARADLLWPKDGVRLLLNMLLIAIDALPRRGTVSVALESDSDGFAAVVSAAGEGARLKPGVDVAITQFAGPGDADPHAAHAYFTHRIAERAAAALDWSADGPDRVSLRFRLPH